jgi:hypothetical protein
MKTTLENLADMDAAPRRLLAPYETARRDQLLRQIVDSPAPTLVTATFQPRPTRLSGRRSARRGWAMATAILAAGVAAAGLVVSSHPGDFFPHPGVVAASGPLTTVELASWTSTPQSLGLTSAAGEAAKSWCLGSMSGAPAASSPATITNADLRGKVASLMIRRGGYTMLCITGPGGGFWEVDGAPSDPASTLASDAIDIESAGSHGDGATGLTYVEGHVGSNVTAISITDAGKTFTATVDAGRWAAWWPTTDPHGTVTGTVTITTTDDSTRTVSGASLLH